MWDIVGSWSRPRTLEIHKSGKYKKASRRATVTSVCWLSLSEVATDCVRVSNFMAAYGRGRSLTRDTMDPRLHFVSLCVKVSTVTCRTRSVTNEQTRPATTICSQRLYGPWLQCSESLMRVQQTVYTWTSALRRQPRHKRQCGAGHPRHKTSKAVAAVCPGAHRQPVTLDQAVRHFKSFKRTVCGLMLFLDIRLREI